MASVEQWIACPKCGEGTFDITSYTSGEFYGFCMHCGFYHERTFKDENHPEEGFEIKEGGGFGVVTEMHGSCGGSYALSEGEIPEITEHTVFASAIIDGKLTVLKAPDTDDKE